MSIHTGFTPDATRARLIDRRMHDDLAASLRHVVDACGDQLPFDRPAVLRLVDALETGRRCSPETFASYYELVGALLDEDRDGAIRIFSELAAQRAIDDARRIAPLQPAEQCARSARYRRMMVEGNAAGVGMLAPDAQTSATFAARFERGMALMRAAAPELAGEIDAIVHEVVPIASDPACRHQMDGGSHFQLWGALFLNASFHPTDVAMMEVIAHESAHSLLFGMCRDEMLVENDDEELYPSPLRTDLRPMDGIYHATFVSARMHWAMARLLESGAAGDEYSAEIRAAQDADRRNFEAGDSVIRAHGRLTRLGAELIDGARRYMATA